MLSYGAVAISFDYTRYRAERNILI